MWKQKEKYHVKLKQQIRQTAGYFSGLFNKWRNNEKRPFHGNNGKKTKQRTKSSKSFCCI